MRTSTIEGLDQMTASTVPTAAGPRRLVPALGAAAAAVLVVNVVLWAVARATDTDLVVTVSGDTQAIGLGMVAAMTVVPFLLGALLLLATRRSAARVWPALAWAGLVLGVLSVAAPLSAEADTGVKVLLSLMHLAAAAGWFTAVRALARG